MLKNYLTIAIRHLLRHKGYSLINVVGLAIGMACCIVILLYVQEELSYDRYHEKADRIYRLVDEISVAGTVLQSASTPALMAPALLRDYPEVVKAVRLLPTRGRRPLLSHGEKRFYEDRFFFADATVFEVFTFPLLKGNPTTALQEPYSVVITEPMARKYFGHDEPIGQILTVDQDHEYTITGILHDLPPNSHFRADFFASFATLNHDPFWKRLLEQRVNHLVYTYLLLPEGYPLGELEVKLPDFAQRYLEELAKLGVQLKPHLQPLARIHLHSHLEQEIEPNSDVPYIYGSSAIALFILLVACINFMNLATARSATRAKEVSMRKVVGAQRWQVILQFLGESVVFSCLALLLAVVLVELALPAFSTLAGKELALAYTGNGWLVVRIVGIALAVGLAAGSYPAFVLSAFQPVTVFKGTSRMGQAGSLFRRVLVVVQFVISIALIIMTCVVEDQLAYMRNKKLGFNKEQVVVMPLVGQPRELLKTKLSQYSGIVGVTASSSVPGSLRESNPLYRPEGAREQEGLAIQTFCVDHDFLKTLGIELAAGRGFSQAMATDTTESLIVNEAAVRKLGWGSPDGAIGRRLISGLPATTVIGVMKDFHFRSLHYTVEPLVLYMGNATVGEWFEFLSVRIRVDRVAETLGFLKTTWREFSPNYPLEYYFLDEQFDMLYKAEDKLGKVFGCFSLLAIAIACLGLFGLASFAAEQRTKEIGIRKVLGASVTSIVLLLSKEFAKLVLVANVIAWPVAHYAMDRWLQDFAYRIEIGWGTFVAGGVLALAIALLTVSVQAIKAALANPVEALRYE